MSIMKSKSTKIKVIDYSTQFNEAIDLYFKEEYVKPLKIFSKILERKDLNVFQKAEVLRRIADCQMNLNKTDEPLSLYEQALELVGDNKHSRCWILASKANALSHLNRYKEALQCYRESIQLNDDPDD